jgi:hypothetical protein
MYADPKVAWRLDVAERKLGWRAVPHTVADIIAFEDQLHRDGKYLLDDMGKPTGTQNLTPEEARWIHNEQVMCQCSARYFLHYCNPPEAPIWMADGTFKPIGEVHPGDVVMGWERITKPTGKTREVYRESRVVAVARRVAPIVKVTMASGTVLRCTPDHLWSSANHGRRKFPWVTARPGIFLRKITDIYDSDAPLPRECGWLGGIYDGEGSRTFIAQYQSHNPGVHRRIYDLLYKLGFGPGETDKGISIGSNYANLMKFILWCKPVREHSIRKYMSLHPHMRGARDQIISVEPDGEGEVVSMQTETGNYVVWGYASKNCFIKEFEHNEIIRFEMLTPQRLLYDIICDLELRDAAIEIILLKARQLGMSTLVELLIAHRIFFGYGVNAIIASADQTKTRLMANMLFLCYDFLPIWMRPKFTRRVESDRGMLIFGHSASGVSFQHGTQTSGIARGTTPTIYHLSEVASFSDPLNQIESSLFKAVHASSSVFGILESTGEGNEGWWADTWRGSKADWSSGRARLCPLFLPWFCGTHIWPTDTWARTHPVPANWVPHKETREHVAKSHLFVRSHPLLSRHLGADWSMPLHQQWFWEVEHEEAKKKGPEAAATFYQEMAGDDEEALQRSAEPVFGHETIELCDRMRKRAYECYTLRGQSIEDSHEVSPDYFDYSPGRERIPVEYRTHKATSRWELIPLLVPPDLDESDREAVDRALVIWEHPQPGINYAIGVDTGYGTGDDSTVASVWALGSGTVPDMQVAEFGSAWVQHVESWAFVLCIAAYYARYMNEGHTKWKEPYVVIEQVKAVGDIAQLQMATLGYTNFHKMPRYDQSPRKIQKAKKHSAKPGFYTWEWSRPLLIDPFVSWVKNGWTIVNSPWLLEEMRHFEVHFTAANKRRLEHEDGENDDRIFAAALANWPAHDTESMTHRSKKRIDLEHTLPRLDFTPYGGVRLNPENSKPMDWGDLLYSTHVGGRR